MDLAFSAITSSSKALRRLLAMSRAGNPTFFLNSLCSLSVICLSSLVILLASEIRVSLLLSPKATFIINSFIETVGFLSRLLVSDFLDFVTPTASTITKWSLFSVADGVTFCKSSTPIVRVPRPTICSK